MKEMITKELKTYGFDLDNQSINTQSSAIFHGESVLNYFEYDLKVLEEISKYKNPVLEIVANFEDGIVNGFSYAYGPRVEEVGAFNDDDLDGVIEWLRR